MSEAREALMARYVAGEITALHAAEKIYTPFGDPTDYHVLVRTELMKFHTAYPETIEHTRVFVEGVGEEAFSARLAIERALEEWDFSDKLEASCKNLLTSLMQDPAQDFDPYKFFRGAQL